MKRNRYILITIIVSITVMALAYAISTGLHGHLMKIRHKQVDINYTIIKTWKLPRPLNEISGISWVKDNTLACIQDEEGIIFMYDLTKGAVVKKVKFAGGGDYEGVAIYGDDAYVMRSDGMLYEILNYDSTSKSVFTYQTQFTNENNMETLAIDPNTKCLITAPKNIDSNSDVYKGLYQISLESKQMEATPIFKIDMNDDGFRAFKAKKAYKTFNPSDIAIHPKTRDIYVLDGIRPKLLIYDAFGNLKAVHQLDPYDFAQPEGITFSPEGTLYISSEARGGVATIQSVKFK